MNTPSADDLRESHALNTHLQSASESDRTRLSRQLHDELGGLMVSTCMDLYTVSQRLGSLECGQKELLRARETIQIAIDFNRRMVESLRPSILDQMGLFAALRWQLKEWGQNSVTVCTESYPAIEPKFVPDASISLFRIAQGALAIISNRAGVKSTDLRICVADDSIWLIFTDDGTPVISDGRELGASDAFASMRHRLFMLGGTFTIHHNSGRPTVMTASMPLSALVVSRH
jgi:two-component system, NarL family, sensor histidine kinase UhpB